MAGNTLVVVKGHILSAQGIVWIVAGEAGEATAALAKTGALGKVERLMPGIPRVIPVGGGFAPPYKPPKRSGRRPDIAGATPYYLGTFLGRSETVRDHPHIKRHSQEGEAGCG